MFFLPSAVATIVPLGDSLIQFSTTFIHVSQNASSCNIMRLFMISKYHLLMYLPGQQSGSSAKLTEPELPVAIPKCPAIHFYFLAFQISFCVFFFFVFFFFTSQQKQKEKCYWLLVFNPWRGVAAEALLGLFWWHKTVRSSVLHAVTRHGQFCKLWSFLTQ